MYIERILYANKVGYCMEIFIFICATFIILAIIVGLIYHQRNKGSGDDRVPHSEEIDTFVEKTEVNAENSESDLPVGIDIGAREIGERAPLQSQIEEIEKTMKPYSENHLTKTKDSELHH